MTHEKETQVMSSSEVEKRGSHREPFSPSKRSYTGSLVRVERTISFIMDKDAQLDIAMREASKKLQRNRKQ